jgi:hypothetical protein
MRIFNVRIVLIEEREGVGGGGEAARNDPNIVCTYE